MKNYTIIFISLFLLCALVNVAEAKLYRVPYDGECLADFPEFVSGDSIYVDPRWDGDTTGWEDGLPEGVELAFSNVLLFPSEYATMEEAIDSAVYGDIIELAPGVYTGPFDPWWPGSGIFIRGAGDVAADTSYFFNLYGGAYLSADSRIENIQLGISQEDTSQVIDFRKGQVDIIVRNVVLCPVNSMGLVMRVGSSGTIENVTVIGTSHTSWRAMHITDFTETIVKSCYIKDFEQGIACYEELVENYNCFDNVQIPVCDFLGNSGEMSPTDKIGTAGVSPPDFAPQYGDFIIDAGDPTDNPDPDGTIEDCGAVAFNKSALELSWDEPPIGTTFIGDTPEPKIFRAGDEFSLWMRLRKPVGYPNYTDEAVQAFVALECYGTYYFWPNWKEDVSYRTYAVSDGTDFSEEILTFTWPEIDGTASGLHFYSIAIAGEVIGPMDCVEFGWQ